MYKNIFNSIDLLILFSLQCFLLFFGVVYFGKIVNPILFFTISTFIAFVYLRQLSVATQLKTIPVKNKANAQAWIFVIIGILSVVVSFEEVRKWFEATPAESQTSDVMLQLRVMFHRWSQGVFPYSPVMEAVHHPYPVYMPMHFLPIGISEFLHFDERWSSFFIYALAAGLFGYYIGTKNLEVSVKIILAALPSLPLWVFILWGREDIFITLEVLIAAYYLILITGLLMRNNAIIFIGICFCLLSRYTFIFWLPLFGFLFLPNQGIKKSMIFLFGIIAVMFALYIYPFLLKDPSILATGVAYHNGCAVGEWEGIFWTAEHGIHFAYLIKMLLGGSAEHGVYVNRVIQALALICTLFIGLGLYFKSKRKVDFYKFSAAFLYLFMLVFYSFSPLTYRYYLVVLITLSVALLAETLVNIMKRSD